MGKAADGWARDGTQNMGEVVLGCVCHSYRLVLVQQAEAESPGSQGMSCPMQPVLRLCKTVRV